MSDWLTVKQAAAYARCSPDSIYLAVKRGRLRAARINGLRHFRFLHEWVDAWLLASSTPEIVNPTAPAGPAAGRAH